MRPVACLLVCASGIAAADKLPDTLKPPAGFSVDSGFSREADFDHVEWSLNGKHHEVAGRAWFVRLEVKPQNKSPDATEQAMRDALTAQGWEIQPKASALVATHTQGGHEQWFVGTFSSGDARATIVEVGPLPHPVTLTPPAREVEKTADTDDFPFVGRYAGATLLRTKVEQRSIDVSPPGEKEVLAGPPIVTKEYKLAANSSAYERMVTYRDAFTRAGWTMIRAQSGSDSLVIAHYARDGRDLYAQLHDGIVSVADIGAQNEARRLAEALAKDGHVAIYGIYFDVDKDLLKPESETALGHILELLRSDPKLRLEVQGHTDSSGTPAHNKPLSEARAAAVKHWLVEHGVGAERLTPKGYGETVPVGDNKTPEGRARNRRVELKRT